MSSEVHVSAALLRFHLGASEESEHAQVDAHLLECRVCLSEYLGLKRRFDSAAAFDERPSPAVRERLRRDVRRGLPAVLRQPRFWAVGAAIAAALCLLLWARTHVPVGHRSAPETLIDTGGESPVEQVL